MANIQAKKCCCCFFKYFFLTLPIEYTLLLAYLSIGIWWICRLRTNQTAISSIIQQERVLFESYWETYNVHKQ